MSRKEGQGPGRRASKRTHTFSIFFNGDKTPRHYIEPTHSAPQVGFHAGAPAKEPPHHPSASCGQWDHTDPVPKFCCSSCFTSVGIPPPRSSGISKTWLKLGTRKAPRNVVTYWDPGPIHTSPGLSGQGSVDLRGLTVVQATVMDNHYQLLYHSHRLHVHGPVPSPWDQPPIFPPSCHLPEDY